MKDVGEVVLVFGLVALIVVISIEAGKYKNYPDIASCEAKLERNKHCVMRAVMERYVDDKEMD